MKLLHMPVRTCAQCLHFDVRVDADGLVETWCGEWEDPIDDVRQAQLCSDFVRVTDQPTSQPSQPTQGES